MAMSAIFAQTLPSADTLGVSVVIRALNEAQYLPQCLKRIQQQRLEIPIEVIVVDSGSSDDTVAIAESHGCKLVHIKKEDFTFGKALNLGIEQAQYSLVVAISAHCIPVGNRWLARLLLPLMTGQAQMTYGSHLAGRGSRSSEINYFHEKFCFPSGYSAQPLLNNGNGAFLRRLWTQRPFDEQLPAQEDMEFALWHMTHSKAQLYFCSQAKVVHYHNDVNKTLFKRLYRELCVEFHLGQNNVARMGGFFARVPYFLIKDLVSSHKKGVMFRAVKGIFAFRAVQSAAYLSAFATHNRFIEGRA